jgi:hypothetical protein
MGTVRLVQKEKRDQEDKWITQSKCSNLLTNASIPSLSVNSLVWMPSSAIIPAYSSNFLTILELQNLTPWREDLKKCSELSPWIKIRQKKKEQEWTKMHYRKRFYNRDYPHTLPFGSGNSRYSERIPHLLAPVLSRMRFATLVVCLCFAFQPNLLGVASPSSLYSAGVLFSSL